MANDSTGGVPVIDFSTIGELNKTWRDAAIEANRQRTLAELAQTAGPLDYEGAARSLFAGGGRQSGLSLARLGQQHVLWPADFGATRAPNGGEPSPAGAAPNANGRMVATAPPTRPDFTVPGQASARLPHDYTPQRAIDEARAAIAAGRERGAVIQRILALGIDPRGL
jgi:hypothetical protein